MIRPTAFHDLSPERARLVRLFQTINFGRIEELEIRNGEPQFSPPPRVFVEVKLDSEMARARSRGSATSPCGVRLTGSSRRSHVWKTALSSGLRSGMASRSG